MVCFFLWLVEPYTGFTSLALVKFLLGHLCYSKLVNAYQVIWDTMLSKVVPIGEAVNFMSSMIS